MAIENRSVPELLSDALTQFSGLIRSEMNLARAEISLKATQAIMGVAMLLGGAFLITPALVLFLMALAAWFEALGLSTPLADLLAGVVGLIIAGIVGWLGLNRLNPENLMPKRTLGQLERDVAAAKEQV
jgi:uncharacterized protein YacL